MKQGRKQKARTARLLGRCAALSLAPLALDVPARGLTIVPNFTASVTSGPFRLKLRAFC
jgi:hypothetical protein